MIRELEPLGPYPCECGAEACTVLGAVVETDQQFFLVSQWFCVEHATDAVAHCVALMAQGHVVGLFDVVEGLAALRSMDALLRERATFAGEVAVDGLFDSAQNRAARRARGATRHRQRYRPRKAGPQSA